MPEHSLEARTPLDGKRLEFAGIVIEEVTDRCLVSIAVPLDGTIAINEALQASYATTLPAVGKSSSSPTDNATILGMSSDQYFMLFDQCDGDPALAVGERIGAVAYVVDQSDGWVMIRMSGKRCRNALERICPIDLHPAAFAVGDMARTSMEHLSAIVLRDGEDIYTLLSARSSATSFAHALQTSARNIA